MLDFCLNPKKILNYCCIQHYLSCLLAAGEP